MEVKNSSPDHVRMPLLELPYFSFLFISPPPLYELNVYTETSEDRANPFPESTKPQTHEIIDYRPFLNLLKKRTV